MGAASAITGGLSAGAGLYQTISGAKEKRDAQKALEAYQRQQLQNEANNLRVSTLGADLQREEASRLAATQVDALQGGGTRALIGGLGRVEAGNQNLNQQIAAGLDEQQVAIDREKMNEEIRLRGMQENRENADIEALSSQYQAGKQDMNMGIGNMVQGIGSVANQFGGASAKGTADAMGSTADATSMTPNNALSTGVMTKSGGSGMGAVSGFGFDEFGNKIAQPINTTFTPRRRKYGLGYTENYDGTLKF
jgi:hypothetical protein